MPRKTFVAIMALLITVSVVRTGFAVTDTAHITVIVVEESSGTGDVGDNNSNTDNVRLMNNIFDPNSGVNGKISYTLSQNTSVTIKVYTLAGKLVRTLVDENTGFGQSLAEWDGTNDKGEPVSNGIYIAKIGLGDTTYTKKFALLKFNN